MKLGKRLLLSAILVFVVTPLAGYLLAGNGNSSEAVRRAQQPLTPHTQNVFAVVSRESAEGITQDALTVENIAKLEAHSLERFRAHMGSEIEAMGKRWNPKDMQAESVIVELGPRRLIVTRFKVMDVELAAQFLGIIDGELVRVACTTNRPGALVLNKGPCNDKIKQAFGVSLNPVENAGG